MNGSRRHRKLEAGSLTQLYMAALAFVPSVKKEHFRAETTPSIRDSILRHPQIKKNPQGPATAFSMRMSNTVNLNDTSLIVVSRILPYRKGQCLSEVFDATAGFRICCGEIPD